MSMKEIMRVVPGGEPEDEFVIMTKDDPAPLIPEGMYQTQCVGWDKPRRYFGQWKLYVRFRICDGEHTGTVLYKAFNYAKPLPRGTDLYKTLVRLHGSRVRKNASLPLSLFKNKVLEVEIRTVTHDHKQRELLEHERYSVVDRIVNALTGGSGT